MTAYPGCAGLARSPFVLTEHISSLLASERSERDTLSRSSMENAYVYTYIGT